MNTHNIAPRPYGRFAVPDRVRAFGLTLTVKGKDVTTGNNGDGWERLSSQRFHTVDNVTCIWVPSDKDGFTLKNGWEDDSVRVRGDARIMGAFLGNEPVDPAALDLETILTFFQSL